MKSKNCIKCGKEFVAGPGAGNGTRKCSDCQDHAKNDYMREYYRKSTRYRDRSKTKTSKTKLNFADRIVRFVNKTQKQKEEKRIKVYSRMNTHTIKENDMYTSGVCDICGTPITLVRHTLSKRCSGKCDAEAKRRYAKAYYEKNVGKRANGYNIGDRNPMVKKQSFRPALDKKMFSNTMCHWMYTAMKNMPRTENSEKLRELCDKFYKILKDEQKRIKNLKKEYTCIVCGAKQQEGKDCKCGIRRSAQKKARTILGIK